MAAAGAAATAGATERCLDGVVRRKSAGGAISIGDRASGAAKEGTVTPLRARPDIPTPACCTLGRLSEERESEAAAMSRRDKAFVSLASATATGAACGPMASGVVAGWLWAVAATNSICAAAASLWAVRTTPVEGCCSTSSVSNASAP